MIKKTQKWVIVGILIFLTSCASTQVQSEINVNCPDSPNCVSSQSADTQHFIKPFTFTDSPVDAMTRLKAALLNEKRVTIVKEEKTYLHAEIRSFIFRFVDDVEFTLIPEKGLIHIRSAARVGYSDLGVNRRRIERIRKIFQK